MLNKLVTARLILYAGQPTWVANTLSHSLKDGLFEMSSRGQIGVIELPVAGLEETLTQMGVLPFVDKYIVRDDEPKEMYLRMQGHRDDRSRWMEDI